MDAIKEEDRRRNDNPLAVPQLRPQPNPNPEKLWANFKRRIYENGWTTKTPQELKERAKKILRKCLITFSAIQCRDSKLDSVVAKEGLQALNK